MKDYNRKTTITKAIAGVLLACCMSMQTAEAESKKLKVFIMAGQSNMEGHARGHTMATLFNADGPNDERLAKLVFGTDGKLSKQRYDEALALGKQLNELTGGITDPKFKAMTDAAEKAAAEAKAEPMKAALEAYKKDVVAASVVSDRVYINNIVTKRSGKLAVGCGADATKIGPEYAFGLSMAEKIDGPILLIKTAWGGKSLAYDFRPPSAPDFKTTKAYADAKAKAAEAPKLYEEAMKKFSQAQEKYKADLAAYEEQMKTADEKTKKTLRKPKAPKQPKEPKPFSKDDAGFYWRSMVDGVNNALADPGKYHPQYDAAEGYEVAGFVWFQGFNDQFNEEFSGHYTENMKLFINDVRKTFKTPQMPFVIGVLGTERLKSKEAVDQNAVSVAQRAAAALPEFKGNVVAVESYTEYALDSLEVFNAGWNKNYYVWNLVGSDKPYHYLGSGKFFVRVGDAFATAMAGMMK
jgi:alpha-galactosidase